MSRLACLLRVTVVMVLMGTLAPAWSQSRGSNLDRAERLDKQIEDLYGRGQYEEALSLAREALRLREQALGPNDPEVASSLSDQGLILWAMGKYPEARLSHERALRIRERALGPMHSDVAASLNNLAVVLAAMGDNAGAKPLYERALRIREQMQGPDHPDIAANLGNLGQVLQQMGDLAGARQLYERALKIDEKALDPNDPNITPSMSNLATVFQAMGDYEKARPLFERTLRIREQALGPDHPDVAVSLSNLGSLLHDMGEIAGAKPLYDRALRIQERSLGPTHPDVATSLNNLGSLLDAMGDYGAAQLRYEQALSIYRHNVGETHPLVATTLNNLAGLRSSMGDKAGARVLYERAIRIDEQASGSPSSSLARDLTNLANLLRDMGDYAEAKSLAERAVKTFQQTAGPNHSDTAAALQTLASIRELMGDQAEARSLMEQAYNIHKQILNPTHPLVGRSLSNLARSLEVSGDYVAARQRYEQALPILERALGPDHPEMGTTLHNLAVVLAATGDYPGALLRYEHALRIREQKLGPHHPEVAITLRNLALLVWGGGDIRRAATLLERSLRIMDQYAQHTLSSMGERQKLAFIHATNFYLGHYLSLPSELVSPSTAYTALMKRKNLAFQALSDERAALLRSGDPSVSRLVEQRMRLAQLLAGLVHRVGKAADLRQRIAEVERELEQVEGELGRASGPFRTAQAESQAQARDVCQVLSSDVVLLDYFRYARNVPGQGRSRSRLEDSYTVFVIRGGRCPVTSRIELGPAEPIDRAVRAFREILTGTKKRGRDLTVTGKPRTGEAESRSEEADVAAKAQVLASLVLTPPVRAALAGASSVLVAPDGPLTLIPFALLSGDDGRTFLIETHVVTMVPSGHDLLRLSRSADEAGQATAEGIVLAGNPDYGATVTSIGERGDDGRRDTSRAGCGLEAAAEFTPLPGTAVEVQTIAALASGAPLGKSVRQAEGRTATERWLAQQIGGMRYVHLATHGYFAGKECARPFSRSSDRDIRVEMSDFHPESQATVGANPLLLSGIALAGANRRGQARSGAEDGILTALEVTGLDLRGAEMVVLSACDTGLGTHHTGQELIGLRWAFRMAGARSLVTSLWKVPDEPTATLMKSFYSMLWETPQAGRPLGKASALRKAQLNMMRENRARFNGDSRPADWAAWVLSGDWQ